MIYLRTPLHTRSPCPDTPKHLGVNNKMFCKSDQYANYIPPNCSYNTGYKRFYFGGKNKTPLPSYKNICKKSCVNVADDEACNEWARKGECNINPLYMLQNCWKSCNKGTCPNTTQASTTCVNVADDEDCKEWAHNGECNKNPSYMLPNCWKSCNMGTCPNTTQAPTKQAPITQAPTTQAPTTQAPTTQAPTTQAPTTQSPTTQAPTTQARVSTRSQDPEGTQMFSDTQGNETNVSWQDTQRKASFVFDKDDLNFVTSGTPTTQAPTTQAPTTPTPTTTPAPTKPGGEHCGSYCANKIHTYSFGSDDAKYIRCHTQTQCKNCNWCDSLKVSRTNLLKEKPGGEHCGSYCANKITKDGRHHEKGTDGAKKARCEVQNRDYQCGKCKWCPELLNSHLNVLKDTVDNSF